MGMEENMIVGYGILWDGEESFGNHRFLREIQEVIQFEYNTKEVLLNGVKHTLITFHDRATNKIIFIGDSDFVLVSPGKWLVVNGRGFKFLSKEHVMPILNSTNKYKVGIREIALIKKYETFDKYDRVLVKKEIFSDTPKDATSYEVEEMKLVECEIDKVFLDGLFYCGRPLDHSNDELFVFGFSDIVFEIRRYD